MRDFLTALAECSATMSVLALIFIALTPALSKRYSAKWIYYAWLVIVVGMIVPFRLHPTSPLIQVSAPIPASVSQAVQGSAVSAAVPTVPVVPAAAVPPPEASLFPWVQLIGGLWFAGFAAFLLFHAVRHLRFLRMVSRWSEPEDDPRTLEALREAKNRMKIAASVGLRVCPSVSSPMTTGLGKPLILLPRNDFSSEELSYIFLHELVHWKRKDLWYKCLVILATAVHWFNPVAYLTAKTISSQCEISCDAEVMRGAGAEERQRYGETILGAIGKRPGVKTVFSTSFNGGKKDMKKRISSIMNTKAKKAGLIVLCLVIAGTMATGAVFAANGKAVNVQSQSQTADTSAVRTAAVKWAEAVKKRDIDAQYNLLSKEYRKNGYTADAGTSSPWVEGYEVSVDRNTADVTYHYATSEGPAGDYEQTLVFVREDGTYKVDSCSNLESIAKPAASSESAKSSSVKSSSVKSSSAKSSSTKSPSAADTVRTVAEKWAEAVKKRDGKAQYSLMSKKLQSKVYGDFSAEHWRTGTSSPWVESYEVSVGQNIAAVSFRYASTTGFAGDYEQTLSFVKENGVYKIDSISRLEQDEKVGVELVFETDGAKGKAFLNSADGQKFQRTAELFVKAYLIGDTSGMKKSLADPGNKSNDFSMDGKAMNYRVAEPRLSGNDIKQNEASMEYVITLADGQNTDHLLLNLKRAGGDWKVQSYRLTKGKGRTSETSSAPN